MPASRPNFRFRDVVHRSSPANDAEEFLVVHVHVAVFFPSRALGGVSLFVFVEEAIGFDGGA